MATATSSSVNVRHLSWGSVPRSTITSRDVPGSDAADSSFDGHAISRAEVVVEADVGPGGREVEEVLGVDGGELLGLPAVAQVADGGRGGVAGVVPSLEGGQQHRAPQRRTGLPQHVVHPPEGTRVPVGCDSP